MGDDVFVGCLSSDTCMCYPGEERVLVGWYYPDTDSVHWVNGGLKWSGKIVVSMHLCHLIMPLPNRMEAYTFLSCLSE